MARPTDWVDTVHSTAVVSGGQAVNSLLGALAPEDYRGATLIRTILAIGLTSTTVAGVWGTQVVDMAIGIASQEAFNAGIVPDPNVGADKPARGWIYRVRKVVGQNGVGGTVVHEVSADIRGARKIENGEVYLIMTNANLAGTPFTVAVTGLERLLIKLA